MIKICIKCGHKNTLDDNGQNLACPRCGVVYAKAEIYEENKEKVRNLISKCSSMSLQQYEDILATTSFDKDSKKILSDFIRDKRKQEETATNENRHTQFVEKLAQAKAYGDYKNLTQAECNYLAKQIILTTETSPVDMKIVERLEIITAECVFGMNLLHDFFTSMSDIFGGRSQTTQNILRDARRECLSGLKREALFLGADAVVGVDLDYSEMSGQGKSMLFLVASGTAVKLGNS